jgi:hypothetical protein
VKVYVDNNIVAALVKRDLALQEVGGVDSGADPLLTKLRGLLDQNDARHSFQAIKNDADVLLTADGGIMHRR